MGVKEGKGTGKTVLNLAVTWKRHPVFLRFMTLDCFFCDNRIPTNNIELNLCPTREFPLLGECSPK